MTLRQLRFFVISDLHRYHGRYGARILLKELLLGIEAKYLIWLRLCGFFIDKQALRPFYLFSRMVLRHYSIKFGIAISPRTVIGPGLYLGHFGGIVVSTEAVIGKNCEISHGVTIGIQNRGPARGVPTIGDNVYIGPGAKLFGNIRIGNGVAIGANCVVNASIPDNAVVVGVPGRVVSYRGTVGIVDRTDYPHS